MAWSTFLSRLPFGLNRPFRVTFLLLIVWILCIVCFLSGSSSRRVGLPFPGLSPEGADDATAVCGVKEAEPAGEVTLYVVTPTYARREQVAELTRLAQTLLHVKNLHWIVAEDADRCSHLVSAILDRFRIPFTHLTSPMPKSHTKLPKAKIPRGVAGRRAGLLWALERQVELRKRLGTDLNAVVYFADDDNTYDIDLFEEIRKTTRVSVFPVGLVGDQSFSTPLVDEDGQVVGFSDPWFAKRKFPIDMAGFATSTKFILESGSDDVVSMPYKVGHEEDSFLRSLNIEYDDLQPLAEKCNKVLVWHTKTVSVKAPNVRFPPGSTRFANVEWILKTLRHTGVVRMDDRPECQIETCTDPGGCGEENHWVRCRA